MPFQTPRTRATMSLMPQQTPHTRAMSVLTAIQFAYACFALALPILAAFLAAEAACVLWQCKQGAQCHVGGSNLFATKLRWIKRTETQASKSSVLHNKLSCTTTSAQNSRKCRRATHLLGSSSLCLLLLVLSALCHHNDTLALIEGQARAAVGAVALQGVRTHVFILFQNNIFEWAMKVLKYLRGGLSKLPRQGKCTSTPSSKDRPVPQLVQSHCRVRAVTISLVGAQGECNSVCKTE